MAVRGGEEFFLGGPLRRDRFFKTHRAWRELRRYAESRDFLTHSLTMLASHGIDLGGADTGVLGLLRALKRGRARRFRVEIFLVIIPADGGALLPHTDREPKAVNISVSMNRTGEWDAGSTALRKTVNFNILWS